MLTNRSDFIKVFITAVFLVTLGMQGYAQKYFTRDGIVSFFSDASVEKIEAVNTKAASVLDSETGQVEFAVLIKSFHFEKALMEEHFNENYLESSKFPKATFKGTIINLAQISFSKNGEYHATVQGDLTIHGVTKSIQTEGVLVVSDDAFHATSEFEIAVADYDIEIPKVVRENIAKIVRVQVDMHYKLMEQ